MRRTTTPSAVTGLLCLLPLAFFGCKDDDEGARPVEGDLQVTAYWSNGQPAQGITVTTEPASGRGVTDAVGVVLFSGINVTTYTVFATYENQQEVSTVQVKADQLNTVALRMSGGPSVGINADKAPRIVVDSIDPTTLIAFDTISLSALVSDDYTPASDIEVFWSVGFDNTVLSRPDANGRSTVSAQLGYPGRSNITISAIDRLGNRKDTSITVQILNPIPLSLTVDTTLNSGVGLKWTQYRRPGFDSYKIQRSLNACNSNDFTVTWATLTEIKDRNVLSYVDTSKVPIATQVCYRVLIDYSTYEEGGRTNIATYRPSILRVVNFVPSQIISHPTEADLVYLIHRAEERVLLYNHKTGAVVTRAQLSGTLGYSEIGNAGQGTELFVPSSNGNVFVLDVNTLARKAVINTTTGVASLGVYEEGFILVGNVDYFETSTRYRTFNRASGAEVGRCSVQYSSGRVRRIPGKLAAISVTVQVSPQSAFYFTFDRDGRFLTEVQGTDSYGFSYTDYMFNIAPSGAYWTAGEEGNLFTANRNLDFLGALDHSGKRGRSVTFSADAATIFSAVIDYDSSTGAPVPSVIVTSYPSRLRSRVINTYGFPVLLERLADGRILSAQSNQAWSFFGEPEGPCALIVIE